MYNIYAVVLTLTFLYLLQEKELLRTLILNVFLIFKLGKRVLILVNINQSSISDITGVVTCELMRIFPKNNNGWQIDMMSLFIVLNIQCKIADVNCDSSNKSPKIISLLNFCSEDNLIFKKKVVYVFSLMKCLDWLLAILDKLPSLRIEHY